MDNTRNKGVSRRDFIKAAALAGVGVMAGAMPKLAAAEQKQAAWPKRSKYSLIDSHLHYMDFIQETDGFAALVKKMDEANVSHAILFGMPMAKQWEENSPNKPAYYLSNDSRTYYYSATDYRMMMDYLRQPPAVRSRFFPFVCGVNANDKYAAKQLRQVLEDFPGEFCGIGELMSRHDDLTALTYGEPPRANHPALLEVYDLAAEYEMPVLIHHNISGSYMKEPIYLQEMKDALAHNRKANIIWAHVGVSRRVEIPNLVEIAQAMLSDNANLYYDVSWVVYDDYIKKDAESMREWSALFEKHPDRFLVGTDKVGHWDTYPNEVVKYYSFLDMLSEKTRRQVCTDNALRLIRLEKKLRLRTAG